MEHAGDHKIQRITEKTLNYDAFLLSSSFISENLKNHIKQENVVDAQEHIKD